MSGNEQSGSGNGNGNGNGDGIPDDLRCKRSDGKQWRCTAKSMPDKTVCEKHYIQAKKRAANSAFRANQKKAKRRSGEMDDFGIPMTGIEHYGNGLASASKDNSIREKIYNKGMVYSPETPMSRNGSSRVPVDLNDDLAGDDGMFEEPYRSYRAPTSTAIMDPSRNISNQSMSPMEYSGDSTDVSAESLGQICHQCQRKDRDRIISCLKCNQIAFCDTCISTRYTEISLEEAERVCPVCRGLCDCKSCLRSDNTIKVRIREISVLDKLQYLHRLLSAVLPVIKQIHINQCTEVELEKKLRGAEIDLVRARLKADEQMCCNVCRIPVVDYYRHCSNCSYDMCLRCCQDLRAESSVEISGDITNLPKLKINFSDKFPEWEANSDGSIPCPPKEYGGCGSGSLNLARIFKMNWVAKLVKNAEEMVSGCKVSHLRKPELCDSRFCKFAEREESGDNFVYCPSLENVKSDGVGEFEKQWAEGRLVVVKRVLDESSFSSWDPEAIWRDTDEKPGEDDPFLKAINCVDGSEVDVRLGEFTKAYRDGRNEETGLPLLWKLKDWPSPSASEEFIFYQRPEFITRFPFLEYIHPRLGLLNVAAKMPHYSLQNDAGPKIYVSCGKCQEIGAGDSSIHYSMRDMVYLLVHTSKGTKSETVSETKPCPVEHDEKIAENVASETILGPGELDEKMAENAASETILGPGELDEKMAENATSETILGPGELDEKMAENAASETILGPGELDEKMAENATSETILSPGELDEKMGENESLAFPDEELKDGELHDLSLSNVNTETNESEMILTVNQETDHGHNFESSCSSSGEGGAQWDVFRRQDVSKLAEYLQRTFQKPDSVKTDFVSGPLYEGLYINEHHKRQLKDEFGVEPWTFEQSRGEAIFIPAGCPFQVRNLQSNVQVALDFLCPESVGESARLAEEIRCLPNDHEAKIQILEIGKISLYAASSAIKEVQKLVLDPKFGAELGFEDPNLTKAVSHNLDKAMKRPQQITCT